MTPFRSQQLVGPRRTGFTLVEMLVSVGLTLLIMLMFTSIFEITTSSMQRSKGLAENDQKARLLTNMLRQDLEHRTFRNLYVHYPGENLGAYLSQDLQYPEYRRGYLYISENDLDDPTDDVLQFTVEIPEGAEPFYGKALELASLGGNPNQPEFDDQNAQANGAGRSRFAEVSYFLRNGMLYRRVLLIREPAPNTPAFPEEPADGAAGNGNELVTDIYANSFWADFDYSAHSAAGNPQFHGAVVWLDNSTPGNQNSLGRPQYRFGHDNATGYPKEYARVDETLDTSLIFIGRYTHEETSHANFRFPSALNGFPDPMAPDPGTGQSTLTRLGTLQNTPAGVVQYLNPNTQQWEVYRGPRRSEDAMLTNVHAFDIEIWDEGLGPDLNGDGFPDGAFAQLGHNETDGAGNPIGAYHISNRSPETVDYGPDGPLGQRMPPAPNPSQNRIFDTWHPGIQDGAGNPLPPPYRVQNTAGEEVPLKMIRITLRYRDVTTEQMREQILTFSVIDDEQV